MKRAVTAILAASGLVLGCTADQYQVDCGCTPSTVTSDGNTLSLSHDGQFGDCSARLVTGGGGGGTCIENGDFGSLFDGWSVAKEGGSNGDFGIRSSGVTPGDLIDVLPDDPHHPFPIHEQDGPGAYALHQSFVVPPGGTTLTFDYFANTARDKVADDVFAGANAENQHWRVDLLPADFTDWFGPNSLSAVLANLFDPDNVFHGFRAPSTSLWQTVTVPIPSSLEGQEVILAFRVVETNHFQNLAVDNVQLGSCASSMTASGPAPTRRIHAMTGGEVVRANAEIFGPLITDHKTFERTA